jgi:hypothetical protein
VQINIQIDAIKIYILLRGKTILCCDVNSLNLCGNYITHLLQQAVTPCVEILDHLSDYQFVKKDSAPWS